MNTKINGKRTDEMADKAAAFERITQALPQLVELLLEERAQIPDASQAFAIPDEARAQWDLFRTLVNTRPPAPASAELIALQDQLLQDLLAYRGTTTLADIPTIEGRERIHLWQGDITTLATDAIVNAANSGMLGCFVPGHFCIDNAIHTFAGIQLRLECARLMEEQGYPEPTGMAKVTDAFNLPSNYVIHTVGPIAGGAATPTDRSLLANCYTSCLDAAADLGCDSIAFCCISTGVFGFPQNEAARIAVETVESWLDQHPGKLEVVFNVFSDKDRSLYHTLLS